MIGVEIAVSGRITDAGLKPRKGRREKKLKPRKRRKKRRRKLCRKTRFDAVFECCVIKVQTPR